MEFRGTTICAVKRNGVTAIAGDGQVTLGESVIFKSAADLWREGDFRIRGLGDGRVFSHRTLRGHAE